MLTVRLVDWPKALRVAHEAITRPESAARAVRTAVGAGPRFQNRDFPLSVVPVLLRDEQTELLRAPLAEYVRLLGKVVRLYRDHREVRDWYGLGDAAETLVDAEPSGADLPWVCRLDGYLDEETEQLKVLENNADAPAGTLFTTRVNNTLLRVAEEMDGPRWPPRPLTYLDPDRFLVAMRAAAAAAAAADPGRCGDPRHVAVLQPANGSTVECVELVDQLRAAGLCAYLADPRELTVAGGRARFGGRPADLCWNKVNTVSWRRYTADGDVLRQWRSALSDTPMVHVNSFGARYVAENKLTLAFVQEFAGSFTTREREIVARLLPWSRRLTEDAVGENGEPLVATLLADPREFVLKEPYDIRGDGVTLGCDVPASRWRGAVAAGAARGHLVQRRVIPARYPVVTPGSVRPRSLAFSVDTFLFGGEVVGFGAKASRHAKVNIFQGGQKLAVHVVSEQER